MPEPTGLDTRRIGWAAFGIVGGIAFAVLGAALLLHFYGPSNNAAPLPITAPAPRLQTAPVPERAAYFAEKERRLHSYGWVDARAGIAHIPLDQAMRLTAAAHKREAK
jgi:hypothetical protein